MTQPVDQILTVEGMRAAEDNLIAAGSSVDALMQIGACATAQGRLELDGGHEHGIVWVELRVTGADASQRPGLALETAVETLARHRGALDFPPADDGTVVLRLRLPAAR